MPYDDRNTRTASGKIYSVAVDTALYAADKLTPVARLAAKHFLSDDSIIVPIRTSGAWTLIMTPSRQELPPKHVAATAATPAQTVVWIRSEKLVPAYTVDKRIVVSIGKQTLTIETLGEMFVNRFSVGVGKANAPTPPDVTGYLQARYLDPSQGQATHPIQPTSLHASAAGDPYRGQDGGLIGLRHNTVTRGDLSHGCVRLQAAAVEAVNALELGTLVSFVP